MQTLLDKSEDKKPVLTNIQAIELFNARCLDLGIPAKDRQKNKFLDLMNEKCIDRKLNLEKLLLGRQSAALLAKWMLTEEISISHLLLQENNLCDAGFYELRKAIATSKSLVVVNLAMNNISPKSGYSMFEVLSTNCSIYSLNIGSFSGA